MRVLVYILLAYFSVLNLMAVSNLHVHHDTVFHTVNHADSCEDGKAEAPGGGNREDFSEHLFENGCIVSAVASPVTPVPAHLLLACEPPEVASCDAFSRSVYVFPEVSSSFSPPNSVTFRLRAPPASA